MRNYNGYGSIAKMSGNRRKPYIVRITAGWELDEANQKVRQIQKVLGYYATRQEAIKALADYNDAPFDLDNGKITFDEVYQLVYPSFKPNFQNECKYNYKYYAPIMDKPIRSIKVKHLQDCIDSCTNSQQVNVKAIAKRVFNYAIVHEMVDKDPTAHVTATAKPTMIERRIFTHDEIEQLWEIKTEWWAKVALMLLYSGMRTKELKTLHFEDIDIDDEVINIRQAKNKISIRQIPIHSHVLPLFNDYKVNGGNLYGYGHSNFNRCLAEIHHNAHECRHTFSTRMHELNIDLLIIQRLLGHTPSTITERIYTHLSIEELRTELEKLDY